MPTRGLPCERVFVTKFTLGNWRPVPLRDRLEGMTNSTYTAAYDSTADLLDRLDWSPASAIQWLFRLPSGEDNPVRDVADEVAAFDHGAMSAVLDATGARMSRPYAFVREYTYYSSGVPFFTVECPACLAVLNSGHHYPVSALTHAQQLAAEHNWSEHRQ